MAMMFGGGGINQTDFSPRGVSLGRGNGSIPYLQTSPLKFSGGEAMLRLGPEDSRPRPGAGGGGVLGAESVRATGSGPFDSAYR